MNEIQIQDALKKRRLRRQLRSGLFLALCLAAGVVGGGLSGYLLDIRGDPASEPTVIIQEEAPTPLSEAPPVYKTIAESVAAKATDSVVEVSTESKVTHNFFGGYVVSGAGSGVILSQDGYIVTNHHVVGGATSIKVRLSGGEEYAATLAGTDAHTDLAVLKIEARGLKPAVLANSADVSVGQPVVVIGNPLGNLGGTVTEGIVSAKDREIIIDGETMALLQTSAAINPGNSGGGLFNEEGNLIGVVNAKSSGEDIEGLGFAVPVDTVKSVVPSLIEHGYVTGRPMLGVGVIDVHSLEALLHYELEEPGVYVASADPSSLLMQWDRITEIDDEPIKTSDDVKRIVQERAAGDTIRVTLQRDGKTLKISIELQEKKPQTSQNAL